MTNPHLTINLDAVTCNASKVREICLARGIRADSVVKCVCGDIKIAEAILEGGIYSLMDSRMKNTAFRKAGSGAPQGSKDTMLSELHEMLSYADWSLISMPRTITELEKLCASRRRI